MLTTVRRWLRDPVFLLALAAALLACVVQSGDLGSVDTLRRLQTTHSFWTSDPPVLAGDYPDFGLRGKDGRIYAWYGIGQSLLMLPQDILGTYIERLQIFDRYGDTDPTVRDMIVAYLTQILITVLTALVCFKLLRQFTFSVNQSTAGVLAFLLATMGAKGPYLCCSEGKESAKGPSGRSTGFNKIFGQSCLNFLTGRGWLFTKAARSHASSFFNCSFE